MDFSIRKLKTSDYDDLLVGWWKDWGWKPPEREVLPELNDDFVKMVNPELKSVDELNNDVLEKINENFAERSRQSFEKEISDALIDKIGFETPPSMVNNYLNNILEDVKKQNNGEVVFVATSVGDYEVMAEDMQEIKRYIKQVGEVIVYYREVTLPNGQKGVGAEIKVDDNNAFTRLAPKVFGKSDE